MDTMDTKLVVRVDNYDDDTCKRLNGEIVAVFKYRQDASDFIRSRIERQVLGAYQSTGTTVSVASADRGEIVVDYGNFRTRTTYTVTQDLR